MPPSLKNRYADPALDRGKYYPDVPLFLLLIPFISAFNYYLTYINIELNWFLFLTFSIDTAQGYIAWWTVRRFILYLDRKMPYGDRPVRRVMVQLLSITLIGLAVIGLLTELTSWVAKGRPAPLDFYTRDLVIISIWFFVINGIYVGLHYYWEWRLATSRGRSPALIEWEGFAVRTGKQDLLLKPEKLAGFYVEDSYVIVCDTAGKKYVTDQSLDNIQSLLPEALFYRLNRQFILHRQLIAGFERAGNGKINVLVREGAEPFPARIAVSRTKAPAFKSWFQKT